MPPSDFLTDAPPSPATDLNPPLPASGPSANGDEETALARLEDDGGPISPPGESAALAAGLGFSPTGETPVSPLSLEQRVRLLEDAVASLQGRRAAAPVPPAPTAIRVDLDKRPPTASVPVATAVPVSVPPIAHPSARGSLLWLFWDTWAEVRAIVRMFFDPRYQLPWSARVLPLLILAAILTSKYWVPFSSIPFLGDWLLVKLVDLFLAFFLFKWLGHEARRYRKTSPDLPANLRL